jgi:beta-galactosidase/beta-glucuronidase
MKRNNAGTNRRNFLRNVALGGAGVTLYGWGGNASAQPAPADATTAAAAARRELRLNPQWGFQKEEAADSANPSPSDTPARAAADFDDRAWDAVGVPHCYNDLDTFQNGNFSASYQGNAWYRNRFQLDASAQGKKVFLEFLGVNIGTAVYVNGKLKPGNTAVPQPGQVTHVGDFLPFVLDVTDEIRPGAENVIAVRVGNISNKPGYGGDKNPPPFVGTSFYTPPGFGTKIDFGMGCGGIVGPVSLYTTSKVHVPANAYSPLQKWGTYVGTVSASADTAKVRIQTNVENEETSPAEVTLVTRILDASGSVVATLPPETHTLKPGDTGLFDQTTDLAQPQLWWPNNSPYGKPHLYRVVSDVQMGGATVDSVESPLGVRMITWDDDYCYVNGRKHLLNGYGHRNIYPALGSAVPVDLQWKDVKLMAESGANLLRVGHVPAFVETVKACDALGVMVLINSGDNEWALKGEPAITYKKEYDRDMIIRFRNHPSVIAWESNNGLAQYSPKETMAIADQWDFIQPRIVGSRDKSDYFRLTGRS